MLERPARQPCLRGTKAKKPELQKPETNGSYFRVTLKVFIFFFIKYLPAASRNVM